MRHQYDALHSHVVSDLSAVVWVEDVFPKAAAATTFAIKKDNILIYLFEIQLRVLYFNGVLYLNA